MNKTPNEVPESTAKVLTLADEIVTRMMEEITERKWWSQFSELNSTEKKLLFRAIADGFNDSTEE